MEINGEDGSKISVESDSKRELGRGLGFPSDDRTVSRSHLLLNSAHNRSRKPLDSEAGLHFEALGRNPIWVLNSESGEIRVFRKHEKGIMRVGDRFCVSAMKPILFTLKGTGEEGKEEKEEEEGLSQLEQRLNFSAYEDMEKDEDLGLGSVDISEIDPIKDFGFLEMGHEFQNYPKTMIRGIKNWDWFLEEQRGDSESDDNSERSRSKGKKGIRRKKKDGENDDEDWTGESEDEKVVISKLRSGKRPRYNTTRSKPLRDTGSRVKLKPKKVVREINEEEEDDEDGDDEKTLGGFIVSDEEATEEEEEDEEKEEEELEDDDDEDDMEE